MIIWTHKVKFNWLHLLALYKDLSGQFQLEAIIEVDIVVARVEGSLNEPFKKFLITNYNEDIINYTIFSKNIYAKRNCIFLAIVPFCT